MTLLATKPKYSEVSEKIRESILSGVIKIGSRLKPDEELANEYKINKRTVAKGLNQLVDEGFLERAPRRGTIVISNSPKSEKSRAVGLLMPDENYGYGDLVRGIVRRISPLRFFPVLVDSAVVENQEQVITLIQNINDHNPYGYIIDGCMGTPFEFIEENIQDLQRVVFIDKYHYDHRIPGAKYALVDYTEGGRRAAKYLIENGHKKIHFLPVHERHYQGEWSSIQFLIMKGFKEVCKENRIEFDEELFWDSFHNRKEKGEVFDILFNRDSGKTGLLVYYDSIVFMEILPELEKRQLHVPEDISIIGFNNIEMAEKLNLTSVSTQQEKTARCAFELLMGYQQENEMTIVPELVIRDTVKNVRGEK